MKKLLLIIFIGSLVLLGGCVTKPNYDSCMIGCFAGLNYNGSGFLEMDIENTDIESLDSCQEFCLLYADESDGIK